MPGKHDPSWSCGILNLNGTEAFGSTNLMEKTKHWFSGSQGFSEPSPTPAAWLRRNLAFLWKTL